MLVQFSRYDINKILREPKNTLETHPEKLLNVITLVVLIDQCLKLFGKLGALHLICLLKVGDSLGEQLLEKLDLGIRQFDLFNLG